MGVSSRSSEREPAVSLRGKSNVIGGWLPSLTYALGVIRMGKILRVHLTVPPDSTLVHRFRNLGEEVFTALREECDVSLEEIDAATTTYHIREIHKRFVRTAAAIVRELLQKHHMSEIVTADEIQETTNA